MNIDDETVKLVRHGADVAHLFEMYLRKTGVFKYREFVFDVFPDQYQDAYETTVSATDETTGKRNVFFEIDGEFDELMLVLTLIMSSLCARISGRVE